ncbi:hydrolase [Candidatus Francisella endociliophora]|uniref:Hydrolase n=1 Tax=Candidatus Francisella endociliophora TaxID=653937 RepID=A0A097EPR5_9GAMM|nr:HD domain-containing protein [Francisella sp. FSC1006]AIT09562.1 hydrolase [Francisella sp. FSC1006]
MTDLEQRIRFIVEADKLKSIYRRCLVQSDNNRRENTAEHSWHAALMAITFKDYASENINMERVLTMLLIHDIVEIYAGDTYAFDDDAILELQHQKELLALDKIFALMPEYSANELKSLWLEFEQSASADAKYAKAIDKSIPVYRNMATNGGGWVINGPTYKQKVVEINKELKEIAPKLWNYIKEQIDIAESKGWLV